MIFLSKLFLLALSIQVISSAKLLDCDQVGTDQTMCGKDVIRQFCQKECDDNKPGNKNGGSGNQDNNNGNGNGNNANNNNQITTTWKPTNGNNNQQGNTGQPTTQSNKPTRHRLFTPKSTTERAQTTIDDNNHPSTKLITNKPTSPSSRMNNDHPTTKPNNNNNPTTKPTSPTSSNPMSTHKGGNGHDNDHPTTRPNDNSQPSTKMITNKPTSPTSSNPVSNHNSPTTKPNDNVHQITRPTPTSGKMDTSNHDDHPTTKPNNNNLSTKPDNSNHGGTDGGHDNGNKHDQPTNGDEKDQKSHDNNDNHNNPSSKLTTQSNNQKPTSKPSNGPSTVSVHKTSNSNCDKIKPCVSKEAADASFKKRCQAAGIKDTCWEKCRYDVEFNEMKAAMLSKQCPIDQMRDYLKCASNNQNNNNCCQQTGLLEGKHSICTPFCNPTGEWVPSGQAMKYMPCAAEMNGMLQCHWASLTDADV